MNDNSRVAAEATPLCLLDLSPTTLIPRKRKKSPVIAHNSDDISCICGLSYDDGFSIACDDCSRWCHAACFDIMEGEVPEEFRCWECFPRAVDKERAVRLQKARLEVVKRRATSPSVERKQLRCSAASALSTPWSLSYVHIPHDIIPHHDSREKLRRHAQHWRGITALDDQASRTTVRPLPSSSFSNPALSLCSNPSVRPPSYTVHTSFPIPEHHLIAPYTSTITPSSSYLSDPLNSYAHLGMPKPFVHLIGPPLDLALDSRIAGNSARFVRSGCRPNAVLRPFLCPRSNQPPETLSFGVFALRDLKADEEVILGWEWDDGHVIHNLPALIESPHTFPGVLPADSLYQEKLHHIRNQMSNILHALSSTFTTCACGAHAKNCAITQMAAFVDGEVAESVDLGPLVGARRGFRTKERVPFSGGLKGVEMCDQDPRNGHLSTDDVAMKDALPNEAPVLSTLNGHDANDPQIAFRKRLPLTKTTGIHCPSTPRASHPLNVLTQVNQISCEDKMPPKMRKRWIHRESEMLRESSARCSESPSAIVGSLAGGMGCDSGSRTENDMNVDDSQSMPPPPTLPTLITRTQDVTSTTSPSSSFARLSLVSPIIPHILGGSAKPPSPEPLWIPLGRAPRPTTVHEIALSMPGGTHQSTAVPPTPTMETKDVEVRPEPFHEQPSPVEKQAVPEPLLPTETPPSNPERLYLQSEVRSDALTCSPSTVVGTSPPPEIPAGEGTRKDPYSPAIEEGLPAKPMDSESDVDGQYPNDILTNLEPADVSPSSLSIVSVTSPSEAPRTAGKVKMSLKDFAIRKRKQREEERTRSATVGPSMSLQSGEAGTGIEVPITNVDDNEADGGDSQQTMVNRHGGEQKVDGACQNGRTRDVLQEQKASQLLNYAAQIQPTCATPKDTPVAPLSSNSMVDTRQSRRQLIDLPMIFPFLPQWNELITEGACQAPTSSEVQGRFTGPPAEDGEILCTNDGAVFSQSIGSPPRFTFLPRSHTPPTQPRSFNASPQTLSPPPSNSSTASSTSHRPSIPPYRSSLPPPSSSPTPPATQPGIPTPLAPLSPRPLPSGPRALRATNLPLSSSHRSYIGSQHIPRGPSADRDRLDRERERAWQRSRVRGPGWGR